MSALGQYCFSAVAVTVASSILLALAPDKQNIKKYLQFLCGLCICMTLISPIKNVPFELNDIVFKSIDYETVSDGEEYRQLQLNQLKNELADTVIEAIENKFGIVCNKCNIEIIDEDENIILNSISIDIDTKSEFMKSDVKKYLENQFECEIDFFESEN